LKKKGGTVLRTAFQPKADEQMKNSHNELLHNLCSSPNIIRTIRQRRMKGGHVVCPESMTNKLLFKNPLHIRPETDADNAHPG
jgi:hypothetical protein